MTPPNRNLMRAGAWLLQRILPPGAAPAFLGDLLEEFHNHRSHGRFVLDLLSIAVHGGVAKIGRPHKCKEGTNMESLRFDVRFAARSLRKRPAISLVVLITLAFGIGAATAIFSVVEGILIRPLPFVDPDRLVAFNELNGDDRMSLAWPNFVDMRERARSFESVACHQGNAFNVIGDGPARRVNGRLVCAPFFDVLGVRMQMGRGFTPGDDVAGAAPVAIVADRFWKQDLGGDMNVVGRPLRTAEMTFTIVGVLPPSYRFARPEDIYVPIGLTITPKSGWLDRGNHFGLNGLARLARGVDVAAANAELQGIAADLRRSHPDTNARNGAQAVPLAERIVGDVRSTLQALMGAVSLLLLLACLNVANLLVARGASRRHELAIRSALGSSRARVIRQLLIESSLLAAGGGVLGAAVGFGLLKLLIALAPEGIPRIENVHLNAASLMFALGAAAACGLLFGAFPALQASSARGTQMLTRASATAVASPQLTRRILIVLELSLAIVLLTGCGLMAQTMLRLNRVDPGFTPAGVLTGRVVLAGDRWTPLDRRLAFHSAALDAVRRLPGVTSAALTLSLPIEGSNWGSVFVVRDKPVPPRADIPSAAFIPVSADYFATMQIPLRAGRVFADADNAGARRVAIVNETFARRLWPGEDPIGKMIKQGWPETPETDSPWREVVGVAADIRLEGVDQDVPLQVYLPLRQEPARSVAIVARTTVPPETLTAQLEAAVQSVEKDLPVTRVLPMTALMSSAIARQRVSTVIFAVFAGVALLVAAVGLYGVVSHSVTERTREIGVRMALGSDRSGIVRLFVRQGIAMAAVGTVAGLAGAYALSRWIAAMLFQVEPTDPATLGGVAILLLVVAVAACYLPARRASQLDPLQALRTD